MVSADGSDPCAWQPLMGLLVVCLTALAFGFFGSVPLAGPIAVMVVSRAADGKSGEALRIGLGASVAEGLYAAIAFWGFSTLLSGSALVVPLSRGAAALVLVGVGIRFAFWHPAERDDKRRDDAGTALLGFTVSALNPTLLVTWSASVAFLHGYVDQPRNFYAIPFGLCAAAGVASWFLLLVRIMKRYADHVRRHVLALVVRALGIALVALGVWSAVRLGASLMRGSHGPWRSVTPVSEHVARVRRDPSRGGPARPVDASQTIGPILREAVVVTAPTAAGRAAVEQRVRDA
jgi:threonine/homoserine/homoserine lactone efflux protein